MMDIGFMELLVIGVVALIVIGPKDMPEMFRQLGRFTGKLRQMAREFQRTMEQAGDESGARDIMRDLKTMSSPTSTGIDKLRTAADKFEKWDPIKNAARPTTPPAPRPVPEAAAPAEAVSVEAPPAMGPATQALADQRAAQAAIARDAADRMRAVTAAPAPAPEPTP